MHRRSWNSFVVATVFASILALTTPFPSTESLDAGRLLAQAQSPAPTTPTFRTDASFVRVDVFATANGRPVADLGADDFEVFEDGQRQSIVQFEYVNIRTAAPDVIRQEPATVAQSSAPSIDPRARVIILFLDSAHVDDASTARIRQPLLTMLRGMLVESDLVAVMTPDMSARDLAFTHKTALLENILERHPFWGESDRLRAPDPAEANMKYCYGEGAITAELLARRRARRTFDSLRELVDRLRDLREERKTIVAVTSGWRLFRQDSSIDDAAERSTPPVPLQPFDPRGRPVTESTGGTITMDICAKTRMELTGIDFEAQFRDIVALANRANASFYPVDPGGLRTTTDADRGAPPIEAGGNRFESGSPASNLRELASETDGKAILNTNELTNVLRAAMEDSSAYYLLGYQTTGKLDGKFHSISVRTRRPGISLRARKGYLSVVVGRTPSATRTTMAAADAAAAAVMRTALDRLTSAARDMPTRANIGVGWSSRDGVSKAAFTVVGEVGDKARDARMDVTIARDSGEPVGASRAVLPAGTGTAALTVLTPFAPPPGTYIARVRFETENGSDTLTIPIQVTDSPTGSGALYFRRRGSQDAPTADVRFRRTEQMHVAVAGNADGAAARLLDRNGQPIAVTLDVASRTFDDGSAWITVRPSLASLAAGDYLVEIATAGQRLLVPFRLIP